jgi:hypothetical protein
MAYENNRMSDCDMIHELAKIVGADMTERSYADISLLLWSTPRQQVEAFLKVKRRCSSIKTMNTTDPNPSLSDLALVYSDLAAKAKKARDAALRAENLASSHAYDVNHASTRAAAERARRRAVAARAEAHNLIVECEAAERARDAARHTYSIAISK